MEKKDFRPEGFRIVGQFSGSADENNEYRGETGLWPYHGIPSTVAADQKPSAGMPHGAELWGDTDSERRMIESLSLGYVEYFMSRYVQDAFARMRMKDRSVREDLNAPLNLGAITMPYIRLVGNMIGYMNVLTQLVQVMYTNDSLRYLVDDYVDQEVVRKIEIVRRKMERLFFPPYYKPILDMHFGVELYPDNMIWVSMPQLADSDTRVGDSVRTNPVSHFWDDTADASTLVGQICSYNTLVAAVCHMAGINDQPEAAAVDLAPIQQRVFDQHTVAGSLLAGDDMTVSTPVPDSELGALQDELIGLAADEVVEMLENFSKFCDVLLGTYGRNPAGEGINTRHPFGDTVATAAQAMTLLSTDLYRAARLWSGEFGWVPASSIINASPRGGGYFDFRLKHTPFFWGNNDENSVAIWRVVCSNPFTEITGSEKVSHLEAGGGFSKRDEIAFPYPFPITEDWMSEFALKGFHGMYYTPNPAYQDDSSILVLGLIHDVGRATDSTDAILIGREIRGITHDRPNRIVTLKTVVDGGSSLNLLPNLPFVDSMYTQGLMPYAKASGTTLWTIESFSDDSDLRSFRHLGFMGNRVNMEMDYPGLMYIVDLSHLFKVPAPLPAAYDRTRPS